LIFVLFTELHFLFFVYKSRYPSNKYFFFSLLLELHVDSTETVYSTEAHTALEDQPEKSER